MAKGHFRLRTKTYFFHRLFRRNQTDEAKEHQPPMSPRFFSFENPAWQRLLSFYEKVSEVVL